jgi:hypothetical protein
MAKSKQKKKKKKPASAPRRDSLSRFGMLSSKFITRMRKTFLESEVSALLWGNDFANRDDKTVVISDLSNALRSMLLRLEIGQPPDSGTPGSASRFLAQLLTETKWPGNTADFPIPRPWDEHTFRLYEVTCAANILICAYSRHLPGDGPSWPPERPKHL